MRPIEAAILERTVNEANEKGMEAKAMDTEAGGLIFKAQLAETDKVPRRL